MTRPGIEPRSPGPLANTLTPRPMSGLLLIEEYYIFQADIIIGIIHYHTPYLLYISR